MIRQPPLIINKRVISKVGKLNWANTSKLKDSELLRLRFSGWISEEMLFLLKIRLGIIMRVWPKYESE